MFVCTLLLSSLLVQFQGRVWAVDDDEAECRDTEVEEEEEEDDEDLLDEDDDFSGVEEFVLDKPGDIDRMVQQVRVWLSRRRMCGVRNPLSS